MSESKVITGIKTRDGEFFLLGEEAGHFGKVLKIAYQCNPHHNIFGANYQPIYTVDFLNKSMRMIVPFHEVARVFTDTTDAPAVENGVKIPALPEG